MPQGQPGQGFGGGGGAFPGGANGYAGRFGPGGFGGRRFLLGGLLFRYAFVAQILFAIALVLLVVAFWFIFQKAGYNGALSLLMLIPLVNIGMMLWFAFSEWPIFKSLREKEAIAASAMAQFGGGAPPAAAVAPPAPAPAPAPAPEQPPANPPAAQ